MSPPHAFYFYDRKYINFYCVNKTFCFSPNESSALSGRGKNQPVFLKI